jgi:hypothetical protein
VATGFEPSTSRSVAKLFTTVLAELGKRIPEVFLVKEFSGVDTLKTRNKIFGSDFKKLNNILVNNMSYVIDQHFFQKILKI